MDLNTRMTLGSLTLCGSLWEPLCNRAVTSPPGKPPVTHPPLFIHASGLPGQWERPVSVGRTEVCVWCQWLSYTFSSNPLPTSTWSMLLVLEDRDCEGNMSLLIWIVWLSLNSWIVWAALVREEEMICCSSVNYTSHFNGSKSTMLWMSKLFPLKLDLWH